MNFWEWICYVVSGEMSFEFFPVIAILPKTKKIVKIKYVKFCEKNTTRYSDQVPSYKKLAKRGLRTDNPSPSDYRTSTEQ